MREALKKRLHELERDAGDYVEVRPLEWFYGDRNAKPIRMTRQEFQARTLDSFYDDAVKAEGEA